jgi:hypothetical protein
METVMKKFEENDAWILSGYITTELTLASFPNQNFSSYYRRMLMEISHE